ncbi:MAG: protein kinase [Deltaproteobacteria bacterium]|nr:protein kinase [Deltaproteobacteria bacterium]
MNERLGRYELIRRIAAGGMGEVFLAEHTGIAGFAKRVALKRIRPELATDAHYVTLFLNEARIGSFLNHPNIVHIFDVGHDNDALWLVMEYIDGIDLKRLARRATLSQAPLTPCVVAAIAAEVLLALDDAHHGGPGRSAPIIHRDISPENVLIARSGAIKVLDFGLAKWVPRQSAVPSMEGKLIFGKVRYMPPEQLKGHLIDIRADLFALGVVMYEALAGALPFGRGDASEVLAQIRAGRPSSPTRGSDAEIDALIFRAMEPRADDRFASAAEMRQALVQYLERRAHDGLPLEMLRTMLRAKAPKDGSIATTPSRTAMSADRAPTEIGLLAAERCGKCGGRFHALFSDGFIMERCESCHGIWLDRGELDRFVGRQSNAGPSSSQGPASFQRAPLDAIVGSCPVCRTGLESHQVPEHPARIECCRHCAGVWLDRGEIDLLGLPSVARWIRSLQ